jgi:hypothetical protein
MLVFILMDVDGQAERPSWISNPREAVVQSKVPILRKKSGELVRPVLRSAFTRRRTASMPSTPTHSKGVHFDANLEHVCYFLQIDRPLAVSEGSSPLQTYENEADFPFSQDGDHPGLDLSLANFPVDSRQRQLSPVYMKRISLSSDNQSLIGAVSVANLAFSKQVVARYTFDEWTTTSEVMAEYDPHSRGHGDDERDLFNFSVNLLDLVHPEDKTMFICIRYQVDGQQFWDNNSSMNYQVEFRMKAGPVQGSEEIAGWTPRLPDALSLSRSSWGMRRVSCSDLFDGMLEKPIELQQQFPLRWKKHTLRNRYDLGASLCDANHHTISS